MKKFLLLFTFLIVSTTTNAQTSVYSDLRNLEEMRTTNEIESYLSNKGYKYKGYAFDEYDRIKYWFCKNCTIDEDLCMPYSTSGGKWYAFARGESEYGWWDEFYTNDFNTWSLSKNSATRNGFSLLYDHYEEENARTMYYYNNEDDHYSLIFYTYHNGIYGIDISMNGE